MSNVINPAPNVSALLQMSVLNVTWIRARFFKVILVVIHSVSFKNIGTGICSNAKIAMIVVPCAQGRMKQIVSFANKDMLRTPKTTVGLVSTSQV